MEDRSVQQSQSATNDWIIAPLCEGTLILVVGVVGLLSHSALLFSSLGATAYEQIEKSRSRSARPYNIVVGHLVGIFCGFGSVALLRVWSDPSVLSTHSMTAGRVWTAVVAVAFTVLLNTVIKAQQPAACSTSLLVALGSFSNFYGAMLMVGGVIVLAIVGEPLRRMRIRTTDPATLH